MRKIIVTPGQKPQVVEMSGDEVAARLAEIEQAKTEEKATKEKKEKKDKALKRLEKIAKDDPVIADLLEVFS